MWFFRCSGLALRFEKMGCLFHARVSSVSDYSVCFSLLINPVLAHKE